MSLLTAGYWQTTYWPSNYWSDDYWQEYIATTLVSSTAAHVLALLLIENLSIGTLPSDEDDNPVFISHEPNNPNTCITVYDTTGITEIRSMRGDVVTHHGVQVRVRNKSYLTAWQLINEINVAFAGVKNETVSLSGDNITIVNCITSTSAIIQLGPTQQNIVEIFVKNYIVSMTNV